MQAPQGAQTEGIKEGTVPWLTETVNTRFAEHELTSAELWMLLSAFIDRDATSSPQERSRGHRRQVFWDAHSQLGQQLLSRQHAAFDPEHEVWKTDDAASAGDADDALTEAVRGFILNKDVQSIKKARLRATHGLFAVWGIYAVVLLPFYFGGLTIPKYTLIVPCIAAVIAVFSLLKAHRTLHGRLRQYGVPQSSSRRTLTRLAELRMQRQQIERADTFADPGELAAAIAKVQAGKLRGTQLWVQLNEFVEKRVISPAERRQLFWNLYHQDKKDLVNKCPQFSPQHAVWASQDENAIEAADTTLTRWSSLDALPLFSPGPWVVPFTLVPILTILLLIDLHFILRDRFTHCAIVAASLIDLALLVLLLGPRIRRKAMKRRIERRLSRTTQMMEFPI